METEDKRIPCHRCYRPTLIKDFPLAGRQPRSGQSHRQRVCKFCLNTAKNELKIQTRFVDKMRTATYAHCRKYNKENNDNLTPKQFKRKFHWPSYQEMGRIAKNAYDAGCPICPPPYNRYLDLNDMTMDVRDREVGYYWYNIGFMCRTKNSQKGTMTLVEFEADNEEWRQWLEWINRKEQLKYGMLLGEQYSLI